MSLVRQSLERTALRDAVVDILCSTSLSELVELACWSPEENVYEARSVDGGVRFRRESTNGTSISFSIEAISKRNPLEDQDPRRFSTIAEETANLNPDRRHNSYPYAYEHIAQLFDHPCAPDVCVVHTSSHRCEDHRGSTAHSTSSRRERPS